MQVMISLILLVTLLIINHVEASCDLMPSTFNCTALGGCPKKSVECNIFTDGSNTDICQCKEGYLWRQQDSEICNYHQFKRFYVSLAQGLPMISWVGGIGMCVIGHAGACAGQLILTVGLICLSCGIFCACAGVSLQVGEGPATICGACVFVGIAIAGLIWWAVSLAQIVNGSMLDSNGCALF